ncbi:uncharacterized protein [Periplaneta americana]|uniref:uncharacterized protein n=1 Tax=Periplaneta americana TaxID=6978 RepID=UPI0037E77508
MKLFCVICSLYLVIQNYIVGQSEARSDHIGVAEPVVGVPEPRLITSELNFKPESSPPRRITSGDTMTDILVRADRDIQAPLVRKSLRSGILTTSKTDKTAGIHRMKRTGGRGYCNSCGGGGGGGGGYPIFYVSAQPLGGSGCSTCGGGGSGGRTYSQSSSSSSSQSSSYGYGRKK